MQTWQDYKKRLSSPAFARQPAFLDPSGSTSVTSALKAIVVAFLALRLTATLLEDVRDLEVDGRVESD